MAKKLNEYQVSFVSTAWIQLDVTAENEQEARTNAEDKLNKTFWNNDDFEVVEGEDKYLGTLNLTELYKII